MSFDINSDPTKLSLNKSDIKHLIKAPIFQKEYNENNEEERITQIEDGFCMFPIKIQQNLNNMECLCKNHKIRIMEIYEREKKSIRKLDKSEYKLLQSEKKVCEIIEEFSILVKKELSNFDGNCNTVSKNEVKSEKLKDTDSYEGVESFDTKKDTNSNNVVPSDSSSGTTICKKSSFVWSNDIIDNEYYSENSILNCENCKISSHNSIISSVDVQKNLYTNIRKDTTSSYSQIMNSENNIKMVSDFSFKLFKNNNKIDDLKNNSFVINNLKTCKTEFKNSYRLSKKLQSYSNLNASKKRGKQFDNLNEFPSSILEFIWNDDDALFYQYKSNFLLKYLNKEGSTRELSDVTYRILFDSKERKFLLVIEKSKMDNSKLIAKINKSIKFYLVGDHDVYCECTNENPTSKEEKAWMMSFKNENDSKKFYDIVKNIQDKQ